MKKLFIKSFILTILGLSVVTMVVYALDPPHNALNDINCTDCHGHGGGGMGMGWNGFIPRQADQETMCKSCHNPSGKASAMVDVANHVGEVAGKKVDCGSCHDPHSPSITTDTHPGGQTAVNLSLIRNDMSKYVPGALEPALFQQKPNHYAFDSGNSPWNAVCQSCHQSTDHHTRDGSGDHMHNITISCTTCHPHEAGFAPEGGCKDCHNQPQGSRRQIVENAGDGLGDFVKNSHHVSGTVEDSDCAVCHYLGNHSSGTVKLKDPDSSTVFDYVPATSEGIEVFCINCHDSDGVARDTDLSTQPFSDGKTVPNIKRTDLWTNSAHNQIGYSQNGGNPVTCYGDGATTGCHGNGHGSDNIKILAGSSFGSNLQNMCYGCHTDGKITNHALSNNRPGGYVSADDIEEAFAKSARHDLGSSIPGGFILQCTSCHNPHTVTGKYWDAESGKTPVTRPDFSDPLNNPRAMGISPWGDDPGEKMDDYAAKASGTGGWYYSTARGGQMIFDQSAKYQPPKSGSGYEFEFDGNVVPDYTSLCLDCHNSDMGGGTEGAINWSGDPYKHGLSSADKPAYISDAGKAGFWGSSGNPDMIFHMNYVTRGRHNGHFMRWPYDSAQRAAGVNFVLSCTDCHEAHGSNRGGFIRERLNVNQNGDCGTGGNPDPDGENCTDATPWNTFCNICHYYYGGQHDGMSCGTAAACHPHDGRASPHRGKWTGSGSVQLMLTAAGFEGDYQKPDFTPEIISAEAHIGSDRVVLTFYGSTYGIFSTSDLTGPLGLDDFWMFDKNGDNSRTITDIAHTAGEHTAIITMSAPLIAADLNVDTIACKPRSVWMWYEGGYNNWATGIIEAQPVSAGPWPIAITGPVPVSISQVTGRVGSDLLYVEFSEPVYTDPGQSGSLEPGDFLLTDTNDDNFRTIVNILHGPGTTTALFTMSAPLIAADIDTDTLAGVANSIYDAYDNAVGSAPVTITGTTCPLIGDFQLNEPASSATASDETGLLFGPVGNPVVAFLGDGYFHGDENQGTYVDIDSNTTCLKVSRAVTIESRFKTDDVDLDYDGPGDQWPERNSTFSRLFERKRTIKITVMRADYGLDNVDERAGKARIQVKYFTDSAARHTCPHPEWPTDPYTGNDARWHQVNTDIDTYPIVSYHWYKMRVVFNADKSRIPIDIWLDDQGTDGNDTGELWAGYINTAMPNPDGSSSCKWGSLPGDYITVEDQPCYIGTPPNHGAVYLFKGLIDWVTWKPVVDYSGVDDLPHY